MFRSVVGRDPRLGQVWLPTDRIPPVDWAPLGTPLGDRYDAPIDLTSDLGLRVWVRQSADRSTVLLHFHHACGDALGTFAFIEDLLALYASLCPGGPAVTPRPLEPGRLLRRGLASIPKRRWYHHPFDLMFGIREGLRFFLKAPSPLAGPSQRAAGEAAGPAEMLSRSLGPDVAARLRAVASASGATVNDVLLCDMFVTMRRWNARHSGGKTGKFLRILDAAEFPRAGRRRHADGQHHELRLSDARGSAIAKHSPGCCPGCGPRPQVIRRDRLSVFFLGSLAAALAAGMLDKLLASKICFSTAVVSNFGLPSAAVCRPVSANCPRPGGRQHGFPRFTGCSPAQTRHPGRICRDHQR